MEQLAQRQMAIKVAPFVVKDLPSLYGGLFKVAEDGRIYRKRGDGQTQQ